MKYLLLILATVFIGCSNNNVGIIKANNLLICDPYLAEQKNQSRYIRINGIKGNRIESTYLTTEQRHTFNLNEFILEVNFYHRLIEDQISNDSKIENQIREIKQVKFGVIEIVLKSKISNITTDKSTQIELVKSIAIEEFEDCKVVLHNRVSNTNVPENLIKLGATKLERSNNRKVLTINIKNDSEEAIIEKLYSNIEIIYKHLADGDIIEFQSLDSKKDIIRSYILINSFGKDLDKSGWCGMGPKIKRFECIYINNHDL